MANPITHCLDRLNLGDNTKVKQRAEEFLGQLSNIPNKIFDKGPYLKAVICIQLAYESLKNYDWDAKIASQLAGCALSAYEQALSITRKQLNLQTKVTLDMLAVALGSTTMLSQANILWEAFLTKYLGKLSGAKKVNAQAEIEQSCWKGAIMYTCAKAFGKNLDKDKLHSLCGCSTAELNKSIKVVKATCDDTIVGLKNQSTSVARGSRRGKGSIKEIEEKNNEEETEEKGKPGDKKKVSQSKKRKAVAEEPIKARIKPVSGIVSMINHQDYLKTKRYGEYKKWKADLIRDIKTTKI